MKKVLSFVLSVAMVICLMPAMAFAADDAAATTATATGLSQFSDADSINNKEAVAVLVGLGIVDGMGDGTFQPAGDLTRAQASKLVSIIIKHGDKNELAAPPEDPFTDVSKSHWAAGAIKLGVENNYINGMGDGTFHPEENVTTAQLATMLEKMLGYSVADVNYQWPENTMAFASDAGLLEGVSKGASENLNREEAAQMIFNALEADTVVKTTVTGGTGVEGGTGYSIKTNKKADYRFPQVLNEDNENVEQLVEVYFNKTTKRTEAADVFGRPATKWKNGRSDITDEVIKEAAYTFTAKKAEKELKSTLNDYDLKSINLWQNGDSEEQWRIPVLNEDGTPGDRREPKIKDIANLTGNGVLVEIYTNEKDTEIERIVVVDYTPDKVSRIVSGKVYLASMPDDPVEEDDDVYPALSSAAKNDHVLIAVKADGTILDAYFPEESSGIIRGHDTKKVDDTKIDLYTVGDGTYEVANTYDDEFINDDLEVNKNKEYNIYLDQYNYLKDLEEAEDTSTDQYILVKVVYSQEDKYGSSTKYVKGVLEDGTVVEDLKVSDDKDNAVKDTVQYDEKTLGTIYRYKETANGYMFYTPDQGKVFAGDASTEDGKIDANAVRINDIYVAGSANMVTLKGKNAGELSATADSIKKLTSGGYQCLSNSKDGKITTVFVENASGAVTSEDIIYVSKVTENTVLYNNTEDKTELTATRVEYYTSQDDGEVQTMYVDNSDAGLTVGFYGEKKEIGTTSNDDTVYELKATGIDATKRGAKIIETNGGTIVSIDNTDYDLGSVEVVDLRDEDTLKNSEVGEITDVADLVKVVGDDKTPVDVTVDFAYDKDSSETVKPITQIYVTAVDGKGAN